MNTTKCNVGVHLTLYVYTGQNKCLNTQDTHNYIHTIFERITHEYIMHVQTVCGN
jgi:hypothetical protein